MNGDRPLTTTLAASVRRRLRESLRSFGADLVRYRPQQDPVHRRVAMLRSFSVTVVLDVGANVGQFAKELRSQGYVAGIVSFEPVAASYACLRDTAAGDRRWQAVRLALGGYDGTAEINISANSESSSVRNMLEQHLLSAPQSGYVGTEEVPMARLDSVYHDFCSPYDRVYLKLDVQGFERDVLMGASDALDRLLGVQLEMSLVPLYEGEMLLAEAVMRLQDVGFELWSLEPGFLDPESGRLLQCDGIFYRRSSDSRLSGT